MNYIVLSETVGEKIKEKYMYHVQRYGYIGNVDSYLKELLSFEGQYKLYSRCTENREYQLIGKSCRLYMEVDNRCSDWLYAKKILFFEKEDQYLSKLSQTVDLPGEWEIVSFKESFELSRDKITSISNLLERLKPSYREFDEFENKLITWDLYNTKLKEYEEKKELESERDILNILLENNIFTLKMDNIPKCYIEGGIASVLLDGERRFLNLGKIINIDKTKNEMEVSCEDYLFIQSYIENKIGKIKKIRNVDFGAKARLSRQNKALKKLFLNESANENLIDILNGDYNFNQEQSHEISIEDIVEMFGSNIRQKEAYVGAINATDIFMIQGPPGTGKTTIIIELVKHAIEKGQKVLVSSETNIAVDNVLERVGHKENVVPVRLGNSERVEEYCQRYIPDAIADTILNRVQRENSFLEEHGVNEQALVEQCEIKWKQKEDVIEKDIKRLEAKISISGNYEKLLTKIKKFETLVLEVNEQHEMIQEEKEEYFSLKNRISKLVINKANIEEQIQLLDNSVMSSGLFRDEKNNNEKKKALASKLNSLEREIIKVRQILSNNRYESVVASYKRKIRRFEKYKSELAEIFIEKESLMAKVHEIRGILEDILILINQLEKIKELRDAEINELIVECARKRKLWETSKDIRESWINVIEEHDIKDDIQRIYMTKTNVVFATCTGISSEKNGHFAEMDYDYVIVDEAAKCNLLDLLIPINMGKKIILVGDHKQLYPMLDIEGIKEEMTQEQIRELREHILFKWLYEEKIPIDYKIMLKNQYRMEKHISEFVSKTFYNEQLICEKDSDNSSSMIWVDCEESEEKYKEPSYQNLKEAEVIVLLLKKLDVTYKKNTTVGIICTYRAQADFIRGLISKCEWSNICVECSTVDAFQGKEKHTIIFNIVRSEKVGDFIKDENRVNVAVSRAQEQLYVVGKASLVKNGKAGVLRDLYEYIKKQGNIYNSQYVR